jgi:hypothetical protein
MGWYHFLSLWIAFDIHGNLEDEGTQSNYIIDNIKQNAIPMTTIKPLFASQMDTDCVVANDIYTH